VVVGLIRDVQKPVNAMRAYKARACACRACFGRFFTSFWSFRADLGSLRAVLDEKTGFLGYLSVIWAVFRVIWAFLSTVFGVFGANSEAIWGLAGDSQFFDMGV